MLKYLSIGLVVIVLLGITSLITHYGIDMNPTTIYGGQNKVVNIEAMENKDIKDKVPADHFCEEMKGQSHQLEEHCNSFTEQSCKYSSCCVYASIEGEEKCMAGNKDGPTFGRNDDGTKKDIDYFYYKRKCYGDKCPHVK